MPAIVAGRTKTKEPIRVWVGEDLHPDYAQGARRAYEGLSRLTQKHSEEYKAGRRAQIAELPKKPGTNRVDWSRCLYRKGGTGWHTSNNW